MWLSFQNNYVCGQIDTPTIVRSPYRNNEVIFATRKAEWSPPGLGFNITYNTYECGEILSGPADIIQTNNSLTYPHLPFFKPPTHTGANPLEIQIGHMWQFYLITS